MIGSQKVYELLKTNYKKEQITPFLSLFTRLDEFSDEKKIYFNRFGNVPFIEFNCLLRSIELF